MLESCGVAHFKGASIVRMVMRMVAGKGNRSNRILGILGMLALGMGFVSGSSAQPMVVESMSGTLTQNEINAFKTYAQQKITAPSSWYDNVWVFGDPGKAIEACGLMYEASKDTAILDRMIYLCDAALSDRNDLATAANGGQLVAWTGTIAPIWPVTVGPPATADVEQGQVLSHMAFCAKLILETPSLWDIKVAMGDPKGYGVTYKARALTYIRQADYVLDKWIFPYFIKSSESNHYYFPGAPNTYKPGEPAPWNQAWMVTNSLVRLGLCHILLQDDPARVAKYDSIALPNIKWFFANLTANKSATGSACWSWDYSLGGREEDANHFAYEAEGLWIAYNSGRFGVTFSDLLPFANTYFDIIIATVTNGTFAGYVDGTTGTSSNTNGDNYVRDEYIYLTEFRPGKFDTVGTIEISTNHIAADPQITGRLLWEKNKRNSFTVVASGDTHGVIIPFGAVNVTSGASQSFMIYPDSLCQIDSVVVDGVNQGAKSSYTFSNVKAAHTIAARFKRLSNAVRHESAWNAPLSGITLVSQLNGMRLVLPVLGHGMRAVNVYTLSGMRVSPNSMSGSSVAESYSYRGLAAGIYVYSIAGAPVAEFGTFTVAP
jgi:hypothetical protein